MDTNVESKQDSEKSDDLKDGSDADAISNAEEENKEVIEKPKKKRIRKREIDRIRLSDNEDNEDDSGAEDIPNKRSKEGNILNSPNSHAHSIREPRSCVLNQRQKRKPLSRLLEQLLRNLEKKDQNQFFAWPVTDNYAPNYSSIIRKPMDFSTMKQKIDDNVYKSLNCFITDFKLMCNNALKYNKPGTVYHKAARKLLHLGLRQLQPVKLRPLGNILTYMYEIPIRELGFDMGKMDVKALKNENCIRENHSDEAKDSNLSEEDKIKLQLEDIREQHRRRLAKRAFPRMDVNGYTSLQILIDNDGINPSTNQRPVSLGLFTGKISHGTGALQGYKESRRNLVKGVKPLNYGAFGSYAPSYDSTFATISKEESHLLYHTFGEETGLSSCESTLRFNPDSPWSCIYNMEELFPSHNENKANNENDYISEDTKIDIEQLKTLSDIGVDIDFLSEIEDEICASQQDFGLQKTLRQNYSAIKKLESEQKERLSSPLPAHLSNVPKPSLSEQETARLVVSNLKEMISRVRPKHVASLLSIRKAMGVTLCHLDTPMTIDELHEISPAHALLGEHSIKESTNSTNEDECSDDVREENNKSEDDCGENDAEIEENKEELSAAKEMDTQSEN